MAARRVRVSATPRPSPAPEALQTKKNTRHFKSKYLTGLFYSRRQSTDAGGYEDENVGEGGAVDAGAAGGFSF
jgi:hypothetical protein